MKRPSLFALPIGFHGWHFSDKEIKPRLSLLVPELGGDTGPGSQALRPHCAQL